MAHRNVTFAAAATLFVPAWLGIFSSGIPTMLGPLPALTSLPALLLANAGIYWIVVGIPSAIFLLWNPQLLRGVAKIPARTFLLFVLCASLTIFYFVGSWNFGIQYQGARFTYVMAVVNGIYAAVIGILFFAYRKGKDSFWKSLTIHWLLFAWLAWCAFPYLGELP
jgi:hypothetical protein